jgi:hypothetical protein
VGVENAVIVNQLKARQFFFTRARVTEPLSYSLRDIVISEASSCKYLGIILRSSLSWTDQFNYTVIKPGRHFILQCVFLKREVATLKV